MLVCHDLKFETEPVAPPLSSGLRVIPVLFYVAIAGCAFFTAYFMIQKSASERARVAQERITSEENKRIAQIQMKHNELEGDLKKANSMIEWVKGSSPIQRLAMKINTSIEFGPEASIRTLKLSRKPESPWQILMALTLNGDDSDALEAALDSLGSGTDKYKRYAPQRSLGDNSVNYTATLVRTTGREL